MKWQPDSPALRTLLAALVSESVPLYLVGGAVRDLLLDRKRPLADLDLVVPHSAIPLARRVADRVGWAFFPLDEGRDVARLVFTGGAYPIAVDISSLRGGTLEDDLLARDFTVNAFALPLHERGGEIIDLAGGRADIAARRIRRISAASLADDPLRLLRAVRFSVELGFPIEESTRGQMLRMPGSIATVSAERVRDELWKIVAGPRPATGIELLRELGLLPWVLPEVAGMDRVTQSAPHNKDVYRHSLSVIQLATLLRDWLLGRPPGQDQPQLTQIAFEPISAPLAEGVATTLRALEPWAFYLRRHFAPAVAAGRTRGEWFVWHAMLHDVGKPGTRSLEVEPNGSERVRFFGHDELGATMARGRLDCLRFSRQEIDLSSAVVRNHMRPHHLNASFSGDEISRRARYRYFRDVGGGDLERPAGIDVLLLAVADLLGTRDSVPPQELHAYLTHVAQMLAFVYSEKGFEAPALRPLVDGRILMEEMGLQPGPELGRLLAQLAEAQAAGEIVSRTDALRLARSLVSGAESM